MPALPRFALPAAWGPRSARVLAWLVLALFAAGVADAQVSSALPDAGVPDARVAGAGDQDAGEAPIAAPVAPGEAEQETQTEEVPQPMVAELPQVEPDPSVAPVIEGRQPERTPPVPVPTAQRSEIVLKTLLGLLALLVLAYLGGHPRVLAWEERLGLSQVVTAGFPFIILGTVARHPSVGVLSDSVLAEIGPLLRLGLGWIGCVVGFRFDARILQSLPASAVRVVTASTLLPFALVVLVCGPLFLPDLQSPSAADLRDPVFLRDAIILGLAGAMSAPTVTRLLVADRSPALVSRIVGLEELSGVFGLALVAAFFRPQGTLVTWQVPAATWVLLTIGLGTTIGLIVYAILQRRSTGPDFLVLTLGSISFAGGAAGYLYLSSVVVAFLAGALLANLHGTYHEPLRDMLLKLERPIYLISLVIVGALWKLDDWRSWALMLGFSSARLAGKWLATKLAFIGEDASFDSETRRALALAPLGSLSIAIVINAQLLYPGGAISMIASAVVGGGLLTELFLQLVSRKQRQRLVLAGGGTS